MIYEKHLCQYIHTSKLDQLVTLTTRHHSLAYVVQILQETNVRASLHWQEVGHINYPSGVVCVSNVFVDKWWEGMQRK